MITNVKIEYLSEQGVRNNEDTFLVDEGRGLFAVFDGASALVRFGGQTDKTGALIAAETARNVFARSNASLIKLALLANAAIESAHHKNGIDTSDPLNRFACTVAAVQLTDGVASLLQSSDTLIITEDRSGNVTLPLGYTDGDLAIMKKWRLLADAGHKNIRALVDDDVKSLRRTANKTYGVLNGDPAVHGFLRTAALPLRDIASILIISDGMFIPKEDPGEEEDWGEHLRLCKESGLDGLLRHVRSLENTDPSLTRYPRYKLHDDATGIFVRFT